MIRTTSIGLAPSLQMQTAAEKLMLEKFPEVTHTFARVGTSEVATDPMGVNVGDSYMSDGGFIALGQVAEVSVTESVNAISREAFQPRMAIQVNLRGRDVQSFVQEAQAKIGAEVKLPNGYFIECGGAFKNLAEARARLAVVVPMALLLIFPLIFMAFGSVRQAPIVYTGIPLAVTGGIFALWLRDLPFSISAAVGFIALSGVAVLNGVMMTSALWRLALTKPIRST